MWPPMWSASRTSITATVLARGAWGAGEGEGGVAGGGDVLGFWPEWAEEGGGWVRRRAERASRVMSGIEDIGLEGVVVVVGGGVVGW